MGASCWANRWSAWFSERANSTRTLMFRSSIATNS
jgi:hypothetical protein